MQLSVREAAERVGVTRQTIFKKIKDGELSATIDHRGNKQVDVTELLRVYGQLQSSDSSLSTTVNRPRQSKQSHQNVDLQLELERSKFLLQMKERELQLAHERIEELKARETELKQRDRDSTEERMRMLGVIETQNRLLSAPSPATKSAKPKPVSKPEPAAKSKVSSVRKKPVPAITSKKKSEKIQIKSASRGAFYLLSTTVSYRRSFTFSIEAKTSAMLLESYHHQEAQSLASGTHP